MRRTSSWRELDAVAVTQGPGLIGALLVGLSTAKAIASARRLPLIPVDHLHGHVAANFLEPEPLDPPFLCLIASGGHTLLAGVRERASFEVLGQTLDDAAGEAFDKGARLLGLGYPGGPAIQRAAEDGDPEAFEFPVAMTRDRGLDLSLQRAEDGARLPGSRPGGRASRPPRGPTWPPPTSARSSTSSSRSSSARSTPATGRRSRSAAASRPTPSCASAPRRSASGAGCG